MTSRKPELPPHTAPARHDSPRRVVAARPTGILRVSVADQRPSVAADFGRQINRHLGQAIRERRGVVDKTQVRLAEEVGLSRASIANIEAGEQAVSVAMLFHFARALDLTPEELLATARDGLLAVSPGELPASAINKLSGRDEELWVLGVLPGADRLLA